VVLTNKGTEARSLLKIVSPVSDKVSLHQTSMDPQGVSRMWPVAKLELQPGESVRFEPGGRHVMFDDIKAPFVAGEKVPLTLKFNGGEPEFTIDLEVRPLVPPDPAEHKHDHK
jgi:copper(I)-binding protein